MRNLQSNPVWEASDLGHPIPDSPHACSVALPLWDHVIGYEEGREDVIERLHCGYPRFVIHETVEKAIATCAQNFAKTGESCLVLPSAKSAESCLAFLGDHGHSGDAHATGRSGVYAVTFPADAESSARLFWRCTGEIVGSRQAAAFLQDGQEPDPTEVRQTGERIRGRIARLVGQDRDDVYLFPTGMAAVAAVHRLLCGLFPGRKSVQFDFPYVDVLKVQQEWGPGVHFFPHAGAEDLAALKKLVSREPPSGIYCELASNPLLRLPDMAAISAFAQEGGFPVVADDTIAGNINIDAYEVADLVTTSLTKYFSGSSDVMGGSLVVNRDSPFHDELKQRLDADYENLLWPEDARILEVNSRDYPERLRRMNGTGEILADWLASRPEVETVYYPKFQSELAFRQVARPGAGYAGMLSVDLRNAASAAPAFYDHLRVSKGPSLGANFTLACPYTLLAHYPELEWAESCGVSRYLIRISFGLEDPEDLISRCEVAFGAISREV